MKTAGRLCASVVFAVLLLGQTTPRNPAITKPKQPSGTRIGPHRLGETFKEWLAVEKIDLDAVCKSGARWLGWDQGQSNAHQSQEDSLVCGDLRPISLDGNGDYRDRRGLGANNGYVDRWTFANGKLAVKQSVYSNEFTTKELGFLKEAYGPPTLITKLPQQNAFGAKWNDILVTWHLSGGTTLYMKAVGGTSEDLIVTFISREYANAPVSHEPNPYLPSKP